MDERRIDRMAKAMAGTGSRRGLLGRAFGVGAAGLLPALGLGRRVAAQDDCGSGLVACPRGATDSICVDLSSAAFHCGQCNRECFGGESGSGVCVGGTCTDCNPGLTVCYSYPYGRCVDRSTDPLNCGECDIVCASGVCENGACVDALACPEGQVECGDRCVDVSSDFENCGACTVYCPSLQCRDGICVTCEELGLGYCPGQGIGNFCTDLRDNPFNCGTCGNVCGAGTICIDGACQPPNGGPIFPPEETPPTPTSVPEETAVPGATAPPAVAVDEPTSTPAPSAAAPTRTPAGPEIAGGVEPDAAATTTPTPARAGAAETPTTERQQPAGVSGTEEARGGGEPGASGTAASGGRCPAADAEAIERVARRWYEALDGGELDALDGLLAPTRRSTRPRFPTRKG